MLVGTIGLEFTGDMVSTTIAYVSAVFSDLSLLLLLIVGVGLGIIVVGAIISSVRGH